MPSVSNPQNNLTPAPAAARPSRTQCVQNAAAIYGEYLAQASAPGNHEAAAA